MTIKDLKQVIFYEVIMIMNKNRDKLYTGLSNNLGESFDNLKVLGITSLNINDEMKCSIIGASDSDSDVVYMRNVDTYLFIMVEGE